jgi:hypothetical protein
MSESISIQSSNLSFSFNNIRKIVQADVEAAKKEWIQSAGRFARLLSSYMQINQDDYSTYLTDANTSPEFYFDPKSNSYRYVDTGGKVANSVVKALLDSRIKLARLELAGYESALLNNRITLETFQEATGRALKSLYIQNYALGNGGFDNISGADLAAIEGVLTQETDRIRRASEAIRQGQLTMPQLSSVLDNTAGAGNTIYQQGKKDIARESGRTLAQRFLGNTINDRHCQDCIEIVAQGIQPIEQIPMPGDRCRCGRRCKCEIVFYISLEEAVASGINN